MSLRNGEGTRRSFLTVIIHIIIRALNLLGFVMKQVKVRWADDNTITGIASCCHWIAGLFQHVIENMARPW